MLIRSKLFVPLGVDLTPLGQRLLIPAAAIPVASALVTGGAGLLGDVLDLFGQKSANKQNLQAVRETNQMNYKIANEANQLSQNQFAQNMSWLKEQYYDDTQYQRAADAARKAGYNPALAMGSVNPVGAVGQASPTQFHAAQMEAGHVDPLSYDSLSDSVGSAVNAYYDNQLKSLQSDSVRLDNTGKELELETKAYEVYLNMQKHEQELENEKRRGTKTDKEIEQLDEEIEFSRRRRQLFEDTYSEQVRKPYTENRLNDALADAALSDKALKDAQKAAVDIGINLTDVQIKAVLQSIKESISRIQTDEGYLDLANKETAQRIISMINQDAALFESLGMSKELLGSEKFKNYAQSIISGFAAGVGAYLGFRVPFKAKPIKGFGSSVPWQK